MSADFVKIYPGFFRGSLTDAPPYARLLFLAMVSQADHRGVALGTARFWANYASITLEQALESLEILSSPDPESTTPDEEGRRIVPFGEGANQWLVVNYAKYYEKSRNEERKEAKRDWDRNNRPSGHKRAKSGSNSDSPTQSVKSDLENENENEIPPIVPQGGKRTRFVKPTATEVQAYMDEIGYRGATGQRFCDHYESRGWNVGKSPMKDWRAAVRTWRSNDADKASLNGLPGRDAKTAGSPF